MAHALMLGVGGTGIRALLYIKKQLLYNSPTNTLPDNVKLLGIDTEAKVTPVGGINDSIDDTVLRGGINFAGQTNLAVPQEYVHLGESAAVIKPWVREIRDEKSKHFKWFDADYFLANNPDTLLNLVDGAGAFRQLGRLALFYGLSTGEGSVIYSQLHRKITDLVNLSPEKSIKVVVIGSIAGGTGAAMFVDLAHLAKKMAAERNGNAEVFSLLVLPEAFQWTPNVKVTDGMKAHGFSALRELKRFLTLFGADLGYEMNYTCHPLGSHKVLAARSMGALFTMVYLFGERGRKTGREMPAPALNVSIDRGVAPTLASWALFLADRQASETFHSHMANHAKHVAEKAGQRGKAPAVVASVGVYSKVLPIESIIKRYELKLGKEFVDRLLPKTDKGKFYPYRLYETEPEYMDTTGRNASEQDWGKPLKMNALLRDIGSGLMFDEANKKPSQASVEALIARRVDDWCTVYKPEDGEEKIFEELKEEVSFFADQSQRNFLKPCSVKGAYCPDIFKTKHYDNPENAAKAKKNELDDKLHQLIIQHHPNLERIKAARVHDFKVRIKSRLANFLNGILPEGTPSPENASKRLAGKLFWTFEYFDEMKARLDKSIRVLGTALKKKEADLQELDTKLAELEKEMKKSERKQLHYTCEFQQKWEIERWKLFCDGEYEVAKEAMQFVYPIWEQLQQWVRVLNDPDETKLSLFRSLDEGLNAVQNEREQAAALLPKVREVINDTQWEDAQYIRKWNRRDKGLVKHDTVDEVLNDFRWEIIIDEENFKLRIRAFLGDSEWRTWPVSETDDQKKKSASERNRSILAKRCKEEFANVRNEMSVLKYYEDHEEAGFSPEELTQEMFNKCDVLLKHEGIGGVEYYAYLAVHHNAGDNYTSRMETKLQNLYGNVNPQNYQLMQYSDRSTLSIVPVVDYVSIDNLGAYTLPKTQYLDTSPLNSGTAMGRTLHHVFVADQEATQLDLLPGHDDLIDHRVTGILEEEVLLRDIVLALQLKIIQKSNLLPWDEDIKNYCFYAQLLTGKMDEVVDKPIIADIEFTDNINQYKDDVPYIDFFENIVLRDTEFRQGKPMSEVMQWLKDALDEEMQKLQEKNLEDWIKAKPGTLPNDHAVVAVNSEGPKRRAYLTVATKNLLYQDFARALRTRKAEIERGRIVLPANVINSEKTMIDVLLKLITSRWMRANHV